MPFPAKQKLIDREEQLLAARPFSDGADALDTLTAAVAVTVAALFVYLKFQQLRTSIRDLKNSREERTLFVATAVGAALTIGSCVAIERASGIPFGTDPPSFAVRRILFAIFIVGVLAFNWVLTVYPDVRERNAFVAGKACPSCNERLHRNRIHRPVMPGSDKPSKVHWFHACTCGELTLYDERGTAHHVVNNAGKNLDG